MIVALGSLLFGVLLIYAGITGLSITALLKGDSTTPAAGNPSLSAQTVGQ